LKFISSRSLPQRYLLKAPGSEDCTSTNALFHIFGRDNNHLATDR
jgi:hypothetical protein